MSIILDADNRWRLAWDSLQWIIQQNRAKPGKPENWGGRKFIMTTKDVLMRDIGYLGIELTEEARERLKRLPYTFSEFRQSPINPQEGPISDPEIQLAAE